MEDLYRFLYGSVVRLLGYNEVYIDVRVDEVAVSGASYRTLDAHQTVFFSSLQHRLAVQILAVARIINVCANPADIFAPAKAPFTQTESSHIQAVTATAP